MCNFCYNPTTEMRKNLVSVLCVVLTFIAARTSTNHVAAFPMGAGHCDTGKAIANGAHGTSGSGSLANGNYELRILEEIASDAASSWSCPSKKMKPNRKASLYTGTEYTITLSSKDADDGGYFKGFLIRLSGKQGEDHVKEALILGPESASVGQDHPLCIPHPGVAGVTHVNPIDKTTVDVILSFNQPVEALLEVTVVRNNDPMGNNLWYYDSYDIVVSNSSSPSSSKSSKSSKACKGIKMSKGSKSKKIFQVQKSSKSGK
jgi:hypothetical protein